MHIKGYNTSTDYELLWKLIHEGYRVPAWIQRIGTDDINFAEVTFDFKKGYPIIYCTFFVIQVTKHQVGNLYDNFVRACKDRNLQFILHNIETQNT